MARFFFFQLCVVLQVNSALCLFTSKGDNVKYTENLILRIEKETRKALEEIAKTEDRSVAYIVRIAIRDFLEGYRK